MSELELKFRVPKEVLASLQQEFKRREARPTPMLARYFDTPDGDLACHGLSLRLRREGCEWVQTLKAEGKSAVDRLEHNAPLSGTSGMPPVLDIARHDGTEAAAALRETLAKARVSELAERYIIDVVRLACDLRPSAGHAEAALDLGTIRADGRAVPLCELELEHKSGDPQALFALAKSWREHGGLWLNTLSKAHRGAALAEGRDYGPPLKASATQLDPAMDGERILRAVLRSVLRQVLGNASEVASGSTDQDHVHQMRVGLRRLRTALRHLGPLARGVDPAWEAPLADAFSRLGAVRDNEVVAEAGAAARASRCAQAEMERACGRRRPRGHRAQEKLQSTCSTCWPSPRASPRRMRRPARRNRLAGTCVHGSRSCTGRSSREASSSRSYPRWTSTRYASA